MCSPGDVPSVGAAGSKTWLMPRWVCADAVVVGLVEQWPSLRDQVVVAERLFGPSGPRMVGEWVAEQAGFIDDGDFAKTFSDHVHLPGIASMDFAHRHIRTPRGICSVGSDFTRATSHARSSMSWHTASTTSTPDRMRTSRMVAVQRPLPACADSTPPAGRSAGRVARQEHSRRPMSRHGTVRWPRHTATVRYPEVALDVVADRFAQLAAADPALSNNLSPAAPDDLRYWHAHQQLWAITRGIDTIGVFAVAPGALGWITGQEINEEVISVAHAGQRYATSAQCMWAHRWATDTTDLLIGTIDRHNHASRATALRAGRPRVLDNVFIRLD